MKTVCYFRKFGETGGDFRFIYKFGEKSGGSNNSGDLDTRLEEKVKGIEVGIVNLNMSAEEAANLAKSEILQAVGRSTDPDVLKAKDQAFQRIANNMSEYKKLEQYHKAQVNLEFAQNNGQSVLDTTKDSFGIPALHDLENAHSILLVNVTNFVGIAIPAQYQSAATKIVQETEPLLQALYDTSDRISSYYNPDSSSFSNVASALENKNPLSAEVLAGVQSDLVNYRQALIDAKNMMPTNTRLIANINTLITQGEEVVKKYGETIQLGEMLHRLEGDAAFADIGKNFDSPEGFDNAVDMLANLEDNIKNFEGKGLEQDPILGTEATRIIDYAKRVANLLQTDIISLYSEPSPDVQDVEKIIDMQGVEEGFHLSFPQIEASKNTLRQHEESLKATLDNFNQKLSPQNPHYVSILNRINDQIKNIHALQQKLDAIPEYQKAVFRREVVPPQNPPSPPVELSNPVASQDTNNGAPKG